MYRILFVFLFFICQNSFVKVQQQKDFSIELYSENDLREKLTNGLNKISDYTTIDCSNLLVHNM